MSAETDCTERHRCQALEIWRSTDPLRKDPTKPHMFLYASCQSFLSKIPHNHPEFECPETTTKRCTIIHEIKDCPITAFRIAQILWNKAKRSFYYIRFACKEYTAIDRCEKPFMGIDNQ